MTTFWLEVGDDGTDRLDLADEVNYMVLASGFDVQDDAESENYQIVSLPLTIFGATKNAMFNARRAVLTKLHQATEGTQPVGSQPFVTLAVKFAAADTLVRWVVTEGTLSQGGLGSVFGNHLGTSDAPSILTLRVLKGALGEAIEYGPFAITGSAPTLHIDGIPGDLPALAEIRAVDQSTNGAVVNRLRWACRSLPELEPGQFVPVLPLGGDSAAADTFTGTYSSIGGTTSWQAIGDVSRAASTVTSGLYDVYLRLRDTAFFSPAPSGVLVESSESISRRQAKVAVLGSVSTSASSSWQQTTRSGSLLILGVRISTGATITAPSGWVLAASATNPPGPGASVALFYKANAAAESGTVTLQFSATATAATVLLVEYRGIALTSPLDKTATNIQSSTNSAASGTTGLLAQNHGLALALHGIGGFSESVEERSGAWSTVSGSGRTLFSERTVTDGAGQSLTGYTPDGTTANWAALVAVFKAADAAPATMPAGSYTLQVTGIDAISMETGSSLPAAVTLSATGAIQLDWIQTAGSVNHRVYWKRDSGNWMYKATASAGGSYTLTGESGATTADPPLQSTIQPGQFRLQVGPESGQTIDITTTPVDALLANSTWEAVYAARVYLPPSTAPLAAAAPGYRISVQGRSSTGSVLDVDALVILPADEQQIDAQYTANDLATLREWVLGTTPTLRSYGFLRDTTDASEQGRLQTLGYALLGPAGTTLVAIPTVAGGVWNVEDVALQVMVIVRPRYEWLAGTV